MRRKFYDSDASKVAWATHAKTNLDALEYKYEYTFPFSFFVLHFKDNMVTLEEGRQTKVDNERVCQL